MAESLSNILGKRNSTLSICSSFSSSMRVSDDRSNLPLVHLLEKFEEDGEETVSIDTVLENSRKFPIKFPVTGPRLENLLELNPFKTELRKQGKIMNRDVAEKYINSTYPLIHERVLNMLATFIHYKMEWGEDVEREFYDSVTVFDLVNKLLKNRPVVFVNSWDHYLLLDGTPGFGGFENVGRDDNPKPELSLSKFNSYDEMRLAALVSLSTMAPLVNDGGKNNCGVIGNGVTHELDGAILGQVGARFEKEGYMDWVDCIVKRNQNTEENGYGKGNKHPKSKFLQAWANVWGLDHLPLFEDVKLNPENYEYIHVKDAYLNKRVYKARIQMLAEVMLIEASNRAKTANRKAYVHVSGLGLSAWMISQIQTRLFIEAWADAIHHMPLNVTDNIACINFSCIPTTRIQGVKSGDKFPSTDITIRFTKRDMLERVPRGCLLVCNYSADSNSYPGNEFWMGSLTSSGAAAAACSSSIAELHNPQINPRVDAKYLRVASRTEGIIHLKQYMKSLKGKDTFP